MDFDFAYFYITAHFLPDYSHEFIHIEGDIYKHKNTGKLYTKRKMVDYGWGQESGYAIFPPLSFDQLIQLIEYKPKWFFNTPLYLFSKKQIRRNLNHVNNLAGAVVIIMQDHVEELIEFLAKKVETNYFEDPYMRSQYREFRFSKAHGGKYERAGRCVGPDSYESILNKHKNWTSIAPKIIDQVYR